MSHGSRPLRGILREEASWRLQKGPGEAASIRRLASSSRPKESPKSSTRPSSTRLGRLKMIGRETKTLLRTYRVVRVWAMNAKFDA